MSQVADLLAASRDAHTRKKRYAGLADKTGKITSPPNYALAEAEIAKALALRKQAEALDPSFLDPAWSQDRVPHATLVAFFEKYPTIP